MTNYYKVPIENGSFVDINYSDIIEGVAYQKHVEEGFGYIMTEAFYSFEEITEEQFIKERG